MTPEKSLRISEIVSHCEAIAQKYTRDWKINPEWPVIESAAYIRLSTDEQVDVDNGSLEQQIHIAVDEAKTRSFNLSKNYKIVQFFIEPGVSGRFDKRIKFQELRMGIEYGSFKAVFIKEVSRIARATEIWKNFFRQCQSKKCEIVIRGLPFNPNDPAGILNLDMLAAYAEYESNNTQKRIQESVYSALLRNGKLNSTHPVLGLDPKVENGKKMRGYYVPNQEELKTVVEIMEIFVQNRSYSKTLDVLKKKGIRNKNGRVFKRHSLETLLLNEKYNGKWIRNSQNKGKDQSSLPINEKYIEVNLPHGRVIDEVLIVRVRKTVASISGKVGKFKNARSIRSYPLSDGLLVYCDGSCFTGFSGTGRSGEKFYYYNNKANKIRIDAELLEKCARQQVARIIKGTPTIRKEIAFAKGRAKDLIEQAKVQHKTLEKEISCLDSQKQKYFENMNNELFENSKKDFESVIASFQQYLANIDKKIEEKKKQLQLNEISSRNLKNKAFQWKELSQRAEEILLALQRHNPTVLKATYQALFENIVIGEEDQTGKRKIVFIVRDPDELRSGVCLRSRLVELNPRPNSRKNLNWLTDRGAKMGQSQLISTNAE